MTRQTSIDCFNQIKANGLLSKRRFEVYEAICYLAPCTSAEAMKGILNKTNVLSQSRARFSELRDLGVIYEKAIRKCNVTGKNVIEWDLTDKLPIKEKAPTITKKQKIEKILIDISDFEKTLPNERDKDILRSIYREIKSL